VAKFQLMSHKFALSLALQTISAVIADASVNGIGAVLVQEGHPVAYYSRKFSPAERNYTTDVTRFMAQCDACQRVKSRTQKPPEEIAHIFF
jgi:hypothetical protein